MQKEKQQTQYPNNQQPVPTYHQPQCSVPKVVTCVSRRPDWLTAQASQLIILVRDASSSMQGSKAKEASQASQDMVAELANPVNKDAFQCGVIDFNSTARIVHPVTAATDLYGDLKPIKARGTTNLAHGLELAKQLIDQEQSQQPSHPPVVIVYSDGQHNGKGDPLAVADDLKRSGAVLLTVAYGKDADVAVLESIATSTNHFYKRSASGGSGGSAGGGELRKFMATVGRTLTMTMAAGHNPTAMLGSL